MQSDGFGNDVSIIAVQVVTVNQCVQLFSITTHNDGG